jgi:hypothetical protein
MRVTGRIKQRNEMKSLEKLLGGKADDDWTARRPSGLLARWGRFS